MRERGARRPSTIAAIVLTAALAPLLAAGGPAAARDAPAPAPAKAPAAPPWEAAFMTAPAAQVAAAARAKTQAGASAMVLFEERVHTFDDDRRAHSRYRQVYKILSQRGVEGWDRVAAAWSPWHQDRPALRARVITPEGRAFALDPKTIETSVVGGDDGAVYSDRQLLRAPLPAVTVGAVVELEVLGVDRAPLFEAGTANRFYFGGHTPTERARLVLDAPAGWQLQHVVRRLPGVRQTESVAGGRRTVTFEGGPFAPLPDDLPGQPSETTLPGYVAYTTGASWAAVATAYAAIVDRQIGRADLAAFLREAGKGADPRRDRNGYIARLLARLGADINYSGVEFEEASIVPRTPAEILARRYGDCKDKALMLTALLRASGIAADVALLQAGYGDDVDADMPGFGDFNHAIVYVHASGDKPFWIDATDRFSAVGELPASDQGRLALVAARSTTALVRTPEAPSAANFTREERVVTVGEDGKVRAVETSDATGVAGRSMRDGYSDAERKKIEEVLTGYMRETYKAKTLARWHTSEVYDIQHPFRLELETADAGLASVTDDAVTVTLPLWALFDRLPEFLRDSDSAERKRAAAAGTARAVDYLYPAAYVYEIRYKVAPPHGFAPDPAPPDDKRNMGPARYAATYHVERDGTVSALFRFDAAKRRLTPAELEGFLREITALGEAPIPQVTFHQVGEAHLDAGRVRDALAEFRRLDAQHPNTALHASQIARAYLQAGLGSAARVEARRAASMAPDSVRAQRTLGWILEHDLVGRRMRPGADRAGAERAYRQALKLDAGDRVAQASLAILLEFDARGEQTFRPPADRLDEVLRLHRALRKDGYTGLTANYLLDLLRAERFKEVLAEKRALDGVAAAQAAYVAALAATAGPADAVREARNLAADGDRAREVIRMAAAELMLLRRYAPSAALFDEAARGHANAAALRLLGARLRATRRHEEVVLDDRSPATAAKIMLSSMMEVSDGGGDRAAARIKSVASPGLAEGLDLKDINAVRRGVLVGYAKRRGVPLEMPLSVMADVIASADLSVEALAGGVQRVQGAAHGADGEMPGLFLAAYAGHYKVVAMGNDLTPVGAEALRLVGAGDLDRARQLLDFAVSGASLGTADEPLSGSIVARLWTKGSAGSPRVARIAAAALAAGGDAKSPAIAEALTDCLASPPDPAGRTACARAKLSLEEHEKRYAAAVDIATDLVKRFPQSRRALLGEVWFLRLAGRHAEARSLLEARAASEPNDWELKSALAQAAFDVGDMGRGDALIGEIIKAGVAQASSYNQRAWVRLVRGQVDADTLAAAEKAVELSQRRSAAALHTLASVQAELNRPEEAYHTLVEELEQRDAEGDPNSAEWYVVGRIAEGYRATDAAREAYAHVQPPKKPDPLDTWHLADRRVRGLSASARR